MNPKYLKRRYRKEYIFYRDLGAPDNWIFRTMEENDKNGIVAMTIVGKPWEKRPIQP